MRARATFVHLSPAAGRDTPSHLVISMTGEPPTTRPRLGVIPVVDRSGSMFGAKLAAATRALTHLSGYLTADDALGLVSFATTASTDVPVTAADTDGVAAFSAALAALFAGGGTALSDGLGLALTQAAALEEGRLIRLVVLTDGRPNWGDTPEVLHAILEDLPDHVSVSFLGVGTDCDHDLLSTLATAGRGNYGFIESAERSADILGTEIGGLLSVEAHQLRVRVTQRSTYAALEAPLGCSAKDLDGIGFTVPVGALLNGSTRHITLPVRLRGPRRGHARPVTVAEVAITGVLGDGPGAVDLLPKVHFRASDALPDRDLDPQLVEIVELAQLAQAQRDAERAAARGDFLQARARLSSLHVTSAAAAGLSASLTGTYADASAYNASSTLRSSSSHALAGTLAGSGDGFDALWSRTVGSYTTADQRTVASQTRLASAAAPADPEDTEDTGDTRDLERGARR